MFGPSFLTDHGDLLMDVIILSLVIILPALVVSVIQLRKHKNYRKHRNIQVGLYITLAIAILLFEYDLKSQGGIWEMTKKSSYSGTVLLTNSVYVHLFFSFTTAFLWTIILPFSFYIFRERLAPNRYSRIHRFVGWTGIIFMIGTGTTGAWLYYLGFNTH